MNYELAKQLKDAGFNQEFRMGHWICEHELLDPTITNETDNCYGEQLIYLPTLSELIEVCADRFVDLNRAKRENDPSKLWAACCDDMDDNVGEGIYFGSTPEEAVARLWLALQNQKKEV